MGMGTDKESQDEGQGWGWGPYRAITKISKNTYNCSQLKRFVAFELF